MTRTGKYEREYFELEGGDRDDSPVKKESMAGHLRRIEKFATLGPGVKILDIGCASGYFLSLCAAKGAEAHGLDASDYAIGRARERAGLRVAVGDAGDRLPYGNQMFSIVTMFDVIEHLAAPGPALRDIARVLENGGRLFLTTPNTRSLERLVLRRRWSGARDATHVRLYNRNSIGNLLRETGFRAVRATTLFPSRPPLVSHILGKTGLGGQLFVSARAAVGAPPE